MKQPEDKKTIDMGEALSVVVRRPLAKTAAERKAAQRERLRAAGVASVTVDLSADLIEGIAKFMKFKDLTQSQVIEQALRQSILRKR